MKVIKTRVIDVYNVRQKQVYAKNVPTANMSMHIFEFFAQF